MMNKQSDKITKRLDKLEEPEPSEALLEHAEANENAHEMQLVPYNDGSQQICRYDSDDDRTNMNINTLDYNTKKGEIIHLDDVDTTELEQYVLTEEQSKLKEMIWKSQNADYLRRQKQIKKRNKKIEEKRRQKRRDQQGLTMSEFSQSAPCEIDESGSYTVSDNASDKDSARKKAKFRKPGTPTHILAQGSLGSPSKKSRQDIPKSKPKDAAEAIAQSKAGLASKLDTSMLKFLFKK